MIEAASHTTGTTAGIWVIVVVMTLLLAFWLSAIVLADRSQARASGRARLPGGALPGPSGTWVGGSVAGERAPEIAHEAAHEPIRTGAAETEAAGDDEAFRQAEMPTRADIPAQASGPREGAGAGRATEMPRQRGGEGDRAARSDTRPGTPDDEERGR
jgi:hypothetical protein